MFRAINNNSWQKYKKNAFESELLFKKSYKTIKIIEIY